MTDTLYCNWDSAYAADFESMLKTLTRAYEGLVLCRPMPFFIWNGGGGALFGWMNVWVLTSAWSSIKPKACDCGQIYWRSHRAKGRGWGEGVRSVLRLCVIP